MKSYEVKDAFGLENLTLVDRPDPKPGAKQILVKVKATSINYRDVLLVKGQYNPRQPLPIIPFSYGAGEVVDIGDEVTHFCLGDRVASCSFHCLTWFGCTSKRSASSARVTSPATAARATFALNRGA